MNLDRWIDRDLFDDIEVFPGDRVEARGFDISMTYHTGRQLGAKFGVALHARCENFAAVVRFNPTTSAGALKVCRSVY
jgi:hypothetical protein